jgi:hypothetical protein
MIRQPAVKGQFYPADKQELKRQVGRYIKKQQDKKVRAIIAPHAGYMFSGRCAGKAYSMLPFYSIYVLIGVNHSGRGEDISISLEDFQTPLGIVRNNKKFGRELLNELKIGEDRNAHVNEHSLEVQLPFLQFLYRDFEIVPIIMKNYSIDSCKRLAKAIIKVSEKQDEEIGIIASSDFTHSGYCFGFIPKEKAENIDKKAINKILNLDIKGFFSIADNTTICGQGAIGTLIEIAKLQELKPRLFCYYTSADIIPSNDKVGYASIAFSKSK